MKQNAVLALSLAVLPQEACKYHVCSWSVILRFLLSNLPLPVLWIGRRTYRRTYAGASSKYVSRQGGGRGIADGAVRRPDNKNVLQNRTSSFFILDI